MKKSPSSFACTSTKAITSPTKVTVNDTLALGSVLPTKLGVVSEEIPSRSDSPTSEDESKPVLAEKSCNCVSTITVPNFSISFPATSTAITFQV